MQFGTPALCTPSSNLTDIPLSICATNSPADKPDVEWLRELGDEGGWIVISGDVRIVRSAHARAAWHESGLTVFFLKPGWTNLPPLEQHAKLAHSLQQILATAERARPGSGFTVSVHGKIEQIYP